MYFNAWINFYTVFKNDIGDGRSAGMAIKSVTWEQYKNFFLFLGQASASSSVTETLKQDDNGKFEGFFSKKSHLVLAVAIGKWYW